MTKPIPQMSSVQLAHHVRRRVLELSFRAHVGHIGSCLSIADVVSATYASPWFDFGPQGDGRDRFVLSKGHAGLALFAVLEALDIVTSSALETFGTDGSAFGVHPESHIDGVDFSTGSLGQGLGMAVGSALAARIRASSRSVVAVLSDAECNAGSTWEAVNFAGHHRLGNLVAIVDVNGQQALGSTREILDQEPFGERWALAGWEVREVDGHDHAALIVALRPVADRPVVVVARTIFGAGVSFMERELDWHYLPMSPDLYERAMREVSESAMSRDAR